MTASRPSRHDSASAGKQRCAIPPLTTTQVRRVHDFIASNLTDKLTLPQIAREVHLSPGHLARRFRVATGQSLRQYIIEHRLQRASHLLETSDLTIAEIAAFVGFADHSHLTRRFKARFGVAPRSARRSPLPPL